MNGAKIIDRFGGVRALARRIAAPPTTVQHWRDTDSIPSARQQQVLEAGRDLVPPVTPGDFFEAAEPEKPSGIDRPVRAPVVRDAPQKAEAA